MIRAMRRVRLADIVSSNNLREALDVFVKIEEILVHSRLRWYSQAIPQDTDSQILEVVELKIEGKEVKGSSKDIVERMC